MGQMLIKRLNEMLTRYSQNDLADILGVSSRTIQNYVSGENEPHQRTARKIEEAYKHYKEGNDLLNLVKYTTTVSSKGAVIDEKDKVIQTLQGQVKELMEQLRLQNEFIAKLMQKN